VFVCAVLGELEMDNERSFFRRNGESDPTTNVTLQVIASEEDKKTWDTMDAGTFDMLEKVFAQNKPGLVEYWHADANKPDKGEWLSKRPDELERRVDALVHEGSTMWIGPDPDKDVVGYDYRPYGVNNVYITGGALWPASGSWNPTLTMVALTQDLADKLLAESAKPEGAK
jgi:choline dehydrogenase-like flavoprotein